MRNRHLHLKKALRAALFALLLSVVGMTKMYAYDFSAVCETGQTLYYNITDPVNHYVELASPRHSGWSGYTKPTGNMVLPENVEYDGVTYWVTSIGSKAFYNCRDLTSIEIPNSVTSIGQSAFEDCYSLASIELPNSVTSIGNSAFSFCEDLTSIEIPNSVITIGDLAFCHCTGLTTVEIPNSLTSIGQFAFLNCSSLTSMTVWADNPPTLGGGYAFSGVNKSIPIYVPCDALEAYQNAAVWNEFTNIIGMCSGEVAVTVNPSEGGTITGAGYYEGGDLCVLTATPNPGFSFGNWTENGFVVSTDSVFSFHFHPTTIVANFNSNSPIVFADANVKALCVANWDTNDDGELSYAEAAAVTDLDTVFRNKSNITSFDELQYFIGLTSIGGYAFYYCSGLISVELPNSVAYISSYAFSSCTGLTSIEIPNSVTSIGYSAFSSCTGLTSIEIPNSVTSIGWYAFSSCTGLTSIEIPNSVISIGGYAFSSCTGLTSMTVWADNPPTLYGHLFSYVNKSIPIYVPCDALEAYQNATGWNEFTNIIGMCSGEVAVMVNPSEGGTVAGAGYYEGGDPCTLTATANPGYSFINWTKDGIGVSNSETYSFIVAGDATCVANFVPQGSTITFADANVKALCVANWDTDGDGELSYVEAAVVTDLDTVFRNKSNITSFDELQYFVGLTSIGYEAFYHCTDLTSVTISNSVTSIGGYAFSSCTGLTSIEIPNSVTSIGGYAFSSCTGLTSIEIPNSVTSISGWAFYACTGLEQIVVEASNTVYDSRGNCNAIINSGTNELIIGCKNTIIPNSVTSIGGGAFSGCSGLTNIEIPNSVTSIGWYAFYSCTGLTSIEIPNSVTSIGDYTFKGCSSLTSIEIPNSVTSIGNYAFSSCTGLTSVELPNSVTSIGSSAFEDCSSLTSIEIPNSVTSIGSSTFENCSSLTSIEIPNSVTFIGNYAFYSCTGLTSVTIGNSVTSIGYDAFRNCTGLTLIEIPNSVISIGDDAFSSCTGLTSVTIGNSVTSIGDYAFSSCTGLTSIELPNSVTSIGEFAFDYCAGLEQIVVEASNTVYDSRGNCNAIINSGTNELIIGCKNTIIPNSVTSIGGGAFSGCSGLTNIEIPNSVTSIGGFAFSGCTGLTSIEIPNSVTSIGNYAFSSCTGLTSVELSNSMTSIGDWAFSGCSSLTNIEIPNSVTSIGTGAFYSCSGLTSMTVWANNPPTLGGGYAFSYVNKSIPIYVPCDALEAYQNANGWNEFTCIIGLCSGEVAVTVNPSESGTVTGAGYYNEGDICVLTATPNSGFGFGKWTENGFVVSTDSVFSFHAHPATIVANFYSTSPIVFADTNVKALCVANWDTDGDGELSYVEAAVVTDLDTVFRNKSNITSFDELQYFNGLTSIGSYAFSECSGLTSIKIPSFVTIIGERAFSECSGLTSIEIPGFVIIIGERAFSECSGLTSVEIPNSVAYIGNYAFWHCSGLESMTVLADYPPEFDIIYFIGELEPITALAANPPYLEGDWWDVGDCFFDNVNRNNTIFDGVSKDIPIYVPCGSLEAYQNARGWREFANYIEMCEVSQTITLSQGWNWFSTYLDITLDDLETALVDALPGTTINIKSQTQNVKYQNGRWAGQLTALDLTRMYMISVEDNCQISLEGLPINPSGLTATINNGANWLAFPYSESMTVTNFFGSFPMSNNQVKSQSQNARYQGNRWAGQLNTLVPGKGYMYISNTSGTRTFTFPTSAK